MNAQPACRPTACRNGGRPATKRIVSGIASLSPDLPALEWRSSFRLRREADCDGEACFAELVILRLLLKSGWHGVWVEAFGGTHYLQTMPNGWSLRSEHISIPSDKHELLQQIRQAGKTTGCFDVFVWWGDRLLFCEAKGPADGLTKPQFGFIEGALACGIPPQALMLVEWSAAA